MKAKAAEKFCAKGFTLIELLITMAISLILMTGVFSVYTSQQKTYVVQDQVSGVQQNLRAAMYYIEREIRMAGCNPTGMTSGAPGIVTAEIDNVQFTEDIVGDTAGSDPDGDTGDTNEDITYYLEDRTGNGVTDLVKDNPGNTKQLLAENIQVLNFIYLDEDGDPLNDMNGTDSLPEDVASGDLDKIRTIQICLIARTGKGEKDFVNTTAYTNLQGDEILAAQSDNIRRRQLSTHVVCRNLGL